MYAVHFCWICLRITLPKINPILCSMRKRIRRRTKTRIFSRIPATKHFQSTTKHDAVRAPRLLLADVNIFYKNLFAALLALLFLRISFYRLCDTIEFVLFKMDREDNISPTWKNPRGKVRIRSTIMIVLYCTVLTYYTIITDLLFF